jgi:hypothetical protein
MMKRILIALLFMLVHAAASAGAAIGHVREYMVSADGYLFFSLDTEHRDRPACATGQWGQWVLPLAGTNGANGKAVYAAILAAYEANRVITVVGKAQCAVWGDRETVDYVYVVR